MIVLECETIEEENKMLDIYYKKKYQIYRDDWMLNMIE